MASKRPLDAPSAAENARVPSDFEPPPWLMSVDEAVGVWDRMAPELRRLHILGDTDRDTFGRYCFHFAAWIKAAEQAPIGQEFVLVKMTNSDERMPRLHPAVKAREIHERHLIDIEDRFGGSPLARYRLLAQQAAHGGLGGLFDRTPAAAADAEPAASAAPASAIGTLRATAH